MTQTQDDDVTSAPLPSAVGSGGPPNRTAVGAPAEEPAGDAYEAMLRFIDGMDGFARRRFLAILRERYPDWPAQ